MPPIQPTAEQYARMMTLLLPPGRLRRDALSNVFKVLLGSADELVRVSERVANLLIEADPEQTSELLPEFEAMLGLVADGTEAERRARVIAQLLRRPRFRPSDFQTVLAPLLGQGADEVVVIETSRALALIIDEDPEIYRFFIYRDPSAPGTYDLDSAQTIVDSMAPSHTKGHVIESIAFACDDPYSLCDRDILGGGVPSTFEVVTGLSPYFIWAGDSSDEVSGEPLNAVGTPRENGTVLGLRVNNQFSNQALEFDDGSTDAWELQSASDFDFDATSGPSWIFVFVLRATVTALFTSRTIFGDRDSGGNGAEVLMNSSGHLLWTVDAGFRSLTQNYLDMEWHVLVVRWRYDTDEIDMATELASTTATAVAGTVTSAAAAKLGAGQAGRPAALGCQIALFASAFGDQVHDLDISALAQTIHGIMVNPIYNAA